MLSQGEKLRLTFSIAIKEYKQNWCMSVLTGNHSHRASRSSSEPRLKKNKYMPSPKWRPLWKSDSTQDFTKPMAFTSVGKGNLRKIRKHKTTEFCYSVDPSVFKKTFLSTIAAEPLVWDTEQWSAGRSEVVFPALTL